MNKAVSKVIATVLALGLCGALDAAQAATFPQENSSTGDSQSSPTGQATSQSSGSGTTDVSGQQELPDSPGTAQSANQKRDEKNINSQEPQGTAAAQAARTHGGAASKPAGAAIAPAKQRRTRSLLIKLGIIAGAGVAIGTVYGLAKASPSRPPGAR
jgi:hypothetical protein